MKTCSSCKQEKPFEEFYNSKVYKGGLGYRCKACDAIARKSYKDKNAEREKAVRRKAQLKFKYGLELEDWDRLYAEQNGVCAICNKGPVSSTVFNQRLVVDHDHKTGKVRGLLCQKCNQALGLFQDSQDNLSSALKYLTKNSEGKWKS